MTARMATGAVPRSPTRQVESPFQAKGLVYLGARDYYERYLPGGVAGVAQRLAEPQAGFLRGRAFVTGGWYDLLPIVAISAAAASVAGTSHDTLVRRNAAWLAHRDVNGVYRVLLRLASPAAVAARLPRASMQYFNFGSADGALVSPGHFRSTRRGIPMMLASWMSWAVEGFTPVALGYAGAKSITVQTRSISPDGERDGFPLARLEFDIRWSDTGEASRGGPEHLEPERRPGASSP